MAVLVINATRGEFEAGFELGGQTREHGVPRTAIALCIHNIPAGLLIRALGVASVIVAVNQMDRVCCPPPMCRPSRAQADWSQDRFDEIVAKFGAFLKSIGFKDKTYSFVPCCGFSGDNLLARCTSPLAAWYTGPVMYESIDRLPVAPRSLALPLRMSVSDVFRGIGGATVAGMLHSGFCQVGETVLLAPGEEEFVVKSISLHDDRREWVAAGDAVHVTLANADTANISAGMVLCDAEQRVPVTKSLVLDACTAAATLTATARRSLCLRWRCRSSRAATSCSTTSRAPFPPPCPSCWPFSTAARATSPRPAPGKTYRCMQPPVTDVQSDRRRQRGHGRAAAADGGVRGAVPDGQGAGPLRAAAGRAHHCSRHRDPDRCLALKSQ